jgi:hypothetical protein
MPNIKTIKGFSDTERTAMQQRAKELAAEGKANKNKAQGEKDILDAISKMSGTDKVIAEKLHTLIKQAAPSLSYKTWYGFPAYTKNDKVVCFFQFAGKFKTRYATLGFSENANLDNGNMWPVAFALTKITPKEEDQIKALLKQAII